MSVYYTFVPDLLAWLEEGTSSERFYNRLKRNLRPTKYTLYRAVFIAKEQYVNVGDSMPAGRAGTKLCSASMCPDAAQAAAQSFAADMNTDVAGCNLVLLEISAAHVFLHHAVIDRIVEKHGAAYVKTRTKKEKEVLIPSDSLGVVIKVLDNPQKV